MFLPHISDNVKEFGIFKDVTLQKMIQEYNNLPQNFNKVPKRTASYRKRFTCDFIRYVADQGNKDLIKKIESINKNDVINQLFDYYIENTNLSAREIATVLIKLGFKATKNSVKTNAKKIYGENTIEYKIRFPAPKDVISSELNKEILDDIKDQNAGSITDISKKYKVSWSSVQTRAKNYFKKNPQDYYKRFPYATLRLTEKTKKQIAKDVLN